MDSEESQITHSISLKTQNKKACSRLSYLLDFGQNWMARKDISGVQDILRI